MKPLNTRALAAQAIIPVIAQGVSLNQTLPTTLQRCTERERPLLQNLVYGTVRDWFYLQALIKHLVHKAIGNPAVQGVLSVGIYQLLRTRIPPHAAIAETVEACKQLGYQAQAGFINAILRRFSQEQDTLCANTAHEQHAHPQWLLKQLRKDWPKAVEQILAANNQPAALTLRINQRKTTREAYLDLLAKQDISAQACQFSPVGIRLTELHDVTQLPLYTQGGFSVQDESAQLAALLLNPAPNTVVLDACAAPAGKTAHLLEQADYLALFAIDNDPKRVQRMHDNLNRLQLNAPFVRIMTADASLPEAWAAQQSFDAILLDAPCTATGVIRRHPDIKLLRKASDVAQTVQLQAQLLQALWPTLKQGGRFLYVTCSVLKAENEQQIGAFLKNTPNAKEIPLKGYWGDARPHGRQILPSINGGDGFYYALLEKTASCFG